MREYIYASGGTPLANANGEISLPRKRIVRCRDCAYFSKSYECYVGEKAKPDGFCAWGERKADDA